jgi:hypothetical protein
MSIRWTLVVIMGFLMTDCGSSSPSSDGCDEGYTSKAVCVQCGPAGGCGKTETKCARNCSEQSDCEGVLLLCLEEVCQVGGCI